MQNSFNINKKDSKKRLDLFVLEQFPQITRSAVKKLILDGVILVDNTNQKPNYKVKKGDSIHVDLKRIQSFLTSNDKSELVATNLNLEVLYEDDDIIAVNKPSGIVSHPDKSHRTQSVLNGIYYHVQQTNQENTRLRMIHRLDKATSGVILAAKHLEAHKYYSKQFAEHRVTKTYKAVVSGDFNQYVREEGFPEDSGWVEIDSFLKRVHNGDIHISEISFDSNDEHAVTFFKCDKSNGEYSLITAKPKTGRTHQIRVHAQAIGYPIVGDELYGGEKAYLPVRQSDVSQDGGHRYAKHFGQADRLMLHAYSLKITKFQTDEQLIITAPLPPDFLVS